MYNLGGGGLKNIKEAILGQANSPSNTLLYGGKNPGAIRRPTNRAELPLAQCLPDHCSNPCDTFTFQKIEGLCAGPTVLGLVVQISLLCSLISAF